MWRGGFIIVVSTSWDLSSIFFFAVFLHYFYCWTLIPTNPTDIWIKWKKVVWCSPEKPKPSSMSSFAHVMAMDRHITIVIIISFSMTRRKSIEMKSAEFFHFFIPPKLFPTALGCWMCEGRKCRDFTPHRNFNILSSPKYFRVHVCRLNRSIEENDHGRSFHNGSSAAVQDSLMRVVD